MRPFQRVQGVKLSALKCTLVMSDAHYGDAGQLLGSLRSTMTEAMTLCTDATEIEVVSNGDAAAGRGIFREQGIGSILQLGSQQVMFCASDFYDWHILSGKRAKWSIIQGNHDYSMRENLAIELAMWLKLMSVPVTFRNRRYVCNLAPAGNPEYLMEFQHGFGASSYYANSAGTIQEALRSHIIETLSTGQIIRRFGRGHTHWMNIGQTIAFDVAIDTTGGWHRQERLQLAGDPRMTGVIVYRHDGSNLSIHPVQPAAGLLLGETNDATLHYQTMAEAAKALRRMTSWAQKQGLA